MVSAVSSRVLKLAERFSASVRTAAKSYGSVSVLRAAIRRLSMRTCVGFRANTHTDNENVNPVLYYIFFGMLARSAVALQSQVLMREVEYLQPYTAVVRRTVWLGDVSLRLTSVAC